LQSLPFEPNSVENLLEKFYKEADTTIQASIKLLQFLKQKTDTVDFGLESLNNYNVLFLSIKTGTTNLFNIMSLLISNIEGIYTRKLRDEWPISFHVLPNECKIIITEIYCVFTKYSQKQENALGHISVVLPPSVVEHIVHKIVAQFH